MRAAILNVHDQINPKYQLERPNCFSYDDVDIVGKITKRTARTPNSMISEVKL